MNSLSTILSIPFKNLEEKRVEILIPFLALCFIHVLSEFFLPHLFPGIYFSLRPKPRDDIKIKEVDLDTAAARDARNKIVSTIFSAYVSILSLRGLYFSAPGEAEMLQKDPFASTIESMHLMQVACAYFLWDIVTLLSDMNDDVILWLIHGGLCLWVFLTSLSPFLHHMGYVTLIFEISTPFLHARKYLLQAKLNESAIFDIIQSLFGVSFILSRIVFGCYMMYGPNQWWWKMQSLITESNAGKAPQLQSVAIIYFYEICCVSLTFLNIMWARTIIMNRFKTKKETKKTL